MVKLKRKIRTIDSLPFEEKKKISLTSIIISLITIITLSILGYTIYNYLIPYLNATDINKIIGKKIYITDCNTKDYIIIGKDKSYSLSLTNNNCETKHYEGTLKIKYNEIIFIENIKGVIDNNYNIIINNNIFESDNNE